jgi:uncharacterized protein
LSIEQNRAMAADFLSALVKPDADRLRALLSEDATYWVAGKPEMFRAAGVMMKPQILKMSESLVGSFAGGLTLTITGTTAEGDKVAVEAISNGSARTGKIYSNTYHFLFIFRGGQISGVKEYMDTQHAAHVFDL